MNTNNRNNKEIGSTFYDVEISTKKNGFFNKQIKWFISGRAALDYILKDIKYKNPKVKTALLPSWCCESMILPFINNDFKIKFYSVVLEDDILVKKIGKKADVLLNMNYFGYESDAVNFDGIVINDVTHSIFRKTINKGEYYFGSLRKWTGLITCGFARCCDDFALDIKLKNNNKYIRLKSESIVSNKKYINGESNSKNYKKKYKIAEDMLNSLYETAAFEEEIIKAKILNVSKIKEQRRKNAQVLLKGIGEYAIFKKIRKDDCPLFVPIVVPNGRRNALRDYLIENHIYCPVHWPISKHHKFSSKEKYLYDNELSIVCDQRYNTNDMKRIVKCISKFMSKYDT